MTSLASEKLLPIERLLHSRAVSKVLDFFVLYRNYDYSKSEVSREADVDWKNLCERVWPILEKYQLVKRTRRIGRAVMYQANMGNPIMRVLDQLQQQIATFDNEKLLRTEAIVPIPV